MLEGLLINKGKDYWNRDLNEKSKLRTPGGKMSQTEGTRRWHVLGMFEEQLKATAGALVSKGGSRR